ncbi:MAG: 50S ribosomal protein L18e [archaeon]
MKNEKLETLIVELKKASIQQEMPFWKRLASDLEKPTRLMAQVNLSKIDRYAKDDEFVVVAGKVLSMGELSKKVTIAAYKFSGNAEEKIKASGSSVLSLHDLIKKNPKAAKVRLLA